MKMMKVVKTNATSEKYSEIHYINLDLVTMVKFTTEKVEFLAGTDSASFTKKETGDDQFERLKLQLEK